MKIAARTFLLFTFFVICWPFIVIAEPLRVGLIVPLSGSVAPFGVAVKNGILMAIDEASPDQRGLIEFFWEDSRYDGKTSISAFNKLTQLHKVDLVYSWGTTPSVVLAPIANAKRIPLLLLSGDPHAAGGHPYTIDFINRIESFSRATLEHARKRGLKNFGIVKSEIQYIETLVQGIEGNLAHGESIITIGSFSADDQPNFSSLILKIRSLLSEGKIDSVGVMLSSGQLGVFFKKMAEQKIDLPIFGSDFFGDINELRQAGVLAAGAFYATPFISEDFSKKYQNRYRNTSEISYAGNAFDFANLLFTAASSTQHQHGGNITFLESIERIGGFNGASGDCHYIEEDAKIFNLAAKRFNCPIVIKKVLPDGSSQVVTQ